MLRDHDGDRTLYLGGILMLALLALVRCLMPFANSEQAIAFACLPVLAVVLWYGWHRIKSGRATP